MLTLLTTLVAPALVAAAAALRVNRCERRRLVAARARR